jgi:hypothetical protein
VRILGTVQSILNDTSHKGSVVLSKEDAIEMAHVCLRALQPPQAAVARVENTVILVDDEIYQMRDALQDALARCYENGRYYAERFNKHKIDAITNLMGKIS